ncbi:MAG TPA: hypothetical protein VEY51_12665, partial [Chondromyces sp.]|nr:hypothetical protein [Chondromyces sp.]
MSIIKGHHMKDAFINLFDEKKNTSHSVLFSFVEKIGTIDPLLFYHNGRSLYSSDRFFWRDQDGELVIVGLGNIITVRSEEKDSSRYKDVEKKWDKLVEEAFI